MLDNCQIKKIAGDQSKRKKKSIHKNISRNKCHDKCSIIWKCSYHQTSVHQRKIAKERRESVTSTDVTKY